MNFEWDENKNASNYKKHGISFEEAKEAFKDENRKEYKDNRKDYGEIRYILIGAILKGIVTIAYTIRGFSYRIISARQAKRKERNKYNNL